MIAAFMRIQLRPLLTADCRGVFVLEIISKEACHGLLISHFAF